ASRPQHVVHEGGPAVGPVLVLAHGAAVAAGVIADDPRHIVQGLPTKEPQLILVGHGAMEPVRPHEGAAAHASMSLDPSLGRRNRCQRLLTARYSYGLTRRGSRRRT